MKRTLLLFDTQQIATLGLTSLAEKMGLFAKVVGGENKAELISKLNHTPNAVVVIDYTKTDLTADRLLMIAQRFTEAHWVIFSEVLSEDFVRRITMSNLHFGIVMKDAPLREIEEAIRTAESGGRYLCDKARNLSASTHNQGAKRAGLTSTETEILKLLAYGKSTKEIAAERFSSVYTIMTHRRNIFSKLGVNNVREATRFALRAGIVDSAEYFI